MRRKVSAFLAVAVAMLLSVALAVPASAAVTPGKPLPPDPRFKYGLSYYYKELFDPTNPSGVRSLNVNESINPSKTGGSWYLNNVKQARTEVPAGVNKPLTGKLFLPGEPLPSGLPGGTVVKPPSVYKPTALFTGTGLSIFGKLLGTAGFGMGGVSQAPSNVNEIATSQGVASGCIANQSTCSSGDMQKLFNISNCGATATGCKAIGGKDAGGNPITNDADWWRDTAMPFLGDLWSKLTGQTDDKTPSADAHNSLGTRGCIKDVRFDPLPGNKGHLTVTSTVVIPSPLVGQYGQTWWDADCGATATSAANLPGGWKTVCVDPATGNTASSTGTWYGNNGGASGWGSDGNYNAAGTLCGAGNTTYTIMSFQWYETLTAAQQAGQPSVYDTVNFYEWINPDPNKDLIDATNITTTQDCQGANGNVFTYSQTVKKVGAFSEPSCPPGFDLVRHDIKATTGSNTATVGNTRTIDSGAVVAGTNTKYPLCATSTGPGCSLWVALDGTACTSVRSDCWDWSAIQARTPSRVQCKWGTYVMPVSDCYGIADAYKTETGIIHDPKSDSWVAVDANGNPQAVNPQPWNPANPTPVPGANPGTTPTTGTSGSTFPTTGTSPSNGCDSPSWSWNPADWVHSPAVCAMKDAFIPKTDVQARLTGMKNNVMDTAPIAWIAAPIIAPSSGGCPDWRIKVDGLDQNVVCGSSFTSAIVGSRGPMFGIVASAMMWPLLRGIWYALIPVLRVTPTGSK